MPEHVPPLLSEPRQHPLADALKSLKQVVSRRLIAQAEHFWQKRYYDFNVRNESQFVDLGGTWVKAALDLGQALMVLVVAVPILRWVLRRNKEPSSRKLDHLE